MTPEINPQGLIIPRKKVNRLYMKCVKVYNATSDKKIRVGDLMKETRKRKVVTPRQWAMYFLKRYSKMSWAKIGGMVGGKDHATAFYAFKTVNILKETNTAYRAQVDEIEKYVVELCKINPPKPRLAKSIIQKSIKKQEVPVTFGESDSDQFKRIADERLLKIRMLEQTIFEQTNRIQSLVSDLKIAEAQTRLFKRKLEYANMPGRILAGE